MEILDLRTVKPPDELSPRARRALMPFLVPLSGLYGAVMRARRAMPADRTRVGIPVISVGSLAVGGTGKTPLCMWIAKRFKAMGRQVCVLSRGYRRKGGPSPLVVSDGREILADVRRAGDEPYMMARNLNGVAVIVGKNRLRSAVEARDVLRADLLVLDDGFQERRLHHDVDVLCFERSTLRASNAPLPWGTLREDWSALESGHFVVVRLDGRDSHPSEHELNHLKGMRVFYCAGSAPRIVDSGLVEVEPDRLAGCPVALVSGIAKPAGFERACAPLGADLRLSLRYEDHHWYGGDDTTTIRSAMRRWGAETILTTEKDIWKLPEEIRRISLILRVDLDFFDREAFLKELGDRLKEVE